MIVSKKNKQITFISLLAVACTIFNMEICRYAIFIFIISQLIQIRMYKLDKNAFIQIVILSSLFLIDLLLMWNNDTWLEGWKQAEKRISFLIFPLFILGLNYTFNLKKFLRYYALLMSFIILIGLISFEIYHPNLVDKYLNGIHLWEMGYAFSNFMGIHAPFLNMQMAFVCLIHFYFLVEGIINKQKRLLPINIFLFFLSFFLILVINTRLALLILFIGIIQILFVQGKRSLGLRKTMITGGVLALLLGICVYIFMQKFPYYQKKFTTRTFSHLDLLGQLDKIEEANKGVFLISRITMWQSGIKLGLEKPMLGHGTARAKPELYKYYQRTEQKYLEEQKMPVHNQYIDFFIKQGIFGLIVFLIFIINFFKIALHHGQPLAMSLFIILFISGFTEDILIRFWGIVFFALFITLFTKDYLQQTGTNQSVD